MYEPKYGLNSGRYLTAISVTFNETPCMETTFPAENSRYAWLSSSRVFWSTHPTKRSSSAKTATATIRVFRCVLILDTHHSAKASENAAPLDPSSKMNEAVEK